MFKIELCKTRDSYSAKPVKNIKLDLAKIEKNFNVITSTPIALVISDKYEIVVHQYGEIIFKYCKNREEAERIAEKIYKIGSK